ncbi:MAG TPA: DUF3551 domain-containing protein [Xanthobacteraceae bacterium]|jgi:hypothetical protein
MSTTRTALAALAFFSAIALTTPALGEIYRPWCVAYPAATIQSCAFTSFEQCMMTARGGGGVCVQNPWYLQYGERSPSSAARYRSERSSRR